MFWELLLTCCKAVPSRTPAEVLGAYDFPITEMLFMIRMHRLSTWLWNWWLDGLVNPLWSFMDLLNLWKKALTRSDADLEASKASACGNYKECTILKPSRGNCYNNLCYWYHPSREVTLLRFRTRQHLLSGSDCEMSSMRWQCWRFIVTKCSF